MTNFDAARERVLSDPDLEIRRGVLIDYDWNDPDHYGCVMDATKGELLAWAVEVDVCARCGRPIDRPVRMTRGRYAAMIAAVHTPEDGGVDELAMIDEIEAIDVGVCEGCGA